jgi:ATP-dependent helicase/nuclease subunit B
VALGIEATAYGRAASERLHAAVARAKAGEPLEPVTVVVPTNSVGVAARRLLASGELGPVTPSGRGVVGVTFLTVYRLAELLGAPRLAAAHRRPVSTPVVAAAIRRELAHKPGLFRPVAQHPATEESLVAAHRELSNLDDAQLDVLAAQHLRAREVVRIHRAARDRLRNDWYDEHDLMLAARESVSAGTPLLRDLGTIVCFLPQRINTPAARLLRTLAEHTAVEIIAGLTGSTRADSAVLASIGRIGGKLDDESFVPAIATEVITASDADDEVRAIVRGIVDAMRDGVPLERMAVLSGVDEPYARLVHEQLDHAGIAHNGVSVRTLADSVCGRALLRMLALGDTNFDRDHVCALFAAAPVLDGRGRRIPPIEWERISRRAGVIAGLGEWSSRLDAYAGQFPDDKRDAREREHAEALRDFVATLADALAAERTTTWAGYANWAQHLVRKFLGDDRRRARDGWPDIEQEAARRVESALDRLAGLDAVDTAPDLDVFRRTLELELNAARDRVGRLGEGVLAGPVGLALGVELDGVWVCGLAEGVFPSVPHDDPLLGDRERAALDGELPLRAERVDDNERALLAALASTSGARVGTWPRGDLRRSTEHVPSRFLHGTLAAVPPYDIASYAQGIAVAPFPPTRHELGVRAALARDEWVRDEPPVARGRELLAARAGDEFTRFDGNLGALGDRLRVVSPFEIERSVSPTRLERWARCPHAYLLETILHVEEAERPEEIMQISPLDRGSMMHEVLDRFVAGGDRDRARLHAIAEEECAAAEARGITGRRLLWERDRRMILADLDAFFDADEVWCAERGAETLATELAFGFADATVPTVEVGWPDGRSLRVRGKADRVDRTSDGGLVVIDYKTGKPDNYNALTAENPVAGGRSLQLPVYARAARAAFGGEPVEAYYWFVGRGNNRRIGYEVDDDVDEIFLATVRIIVDGIEAGLFVARPPAPGPSPWVECPYCDPDGLGTAGVWREWERKYAAPELAGYRVLLEEQ